MRCCAGTCSITQCWDLFIAQPWVPRKKLSRDGCQPGISGRTGLQLQNCHLCIPGLRRIPGLALIDTPRLKMESPRRFSLFRLNAVRAVHSMVLLLKRQIREDRDTTFLMSPPEFRSFKLRVARSGSTELMPGLKVPKVEWSLKELPSFPDPALKSVFGCTGCTGKRILRLNWKPPAFHTTRPVATTAPLGTGREQARSSSLLSPAGFLN